MYIAIREIVEIFFMVEKSSINTRSNFMKKKNTVKKAAALFLSLGLALGGTGCAFVTTDTDADIQQTVAKVNIVKYLENDGEYGTFASQLSEIITKGNLETEILKSDLISMFLSVGYNYVQSYGYSYKDTFNLLMDSLVSRKIMAQYAMAYYMEKDERLNWNE